MTVDPLRLSELLCARLLHDLAGPMGALANGAELLADDPDPDTVREAGALVGATAQQLARRLRLFRAAFGWEGGAPADPQEAGRLLKDHLAPLDGQAETLRLEWRAPTAGLSRPQIKLALLLALMAAESLPRGGELAVEIGPQAIVVGARGVGAKLETSQAAILKGEEPAELSPRNALGLAVRFLTNSVKGYLVIEEAKDHIMLRVGLEQPK
ncbi:MAG: hypothetical protein HZC25_14075 [Rhodospirillales bacterium]|nr:hypothetical protein [Rhodospirillales bacterium]